MRIESWAPSDSRKEQRQERGEALRCAREWRVGGAFFIGFHGRLRRPIEFGWRRSFSELEIEPLQRGQSLAGGNEYLSGAASSPFERRARNPGLASAAFCAPRLRDLREPV